MPTNKVSRAVAVERFLAATVELLASRPAAALTLSEIAESAGLKQHHAHRFFGTRLDLLTEVSDYLATTVATTADRLCTTSPMSSRQIIEMCRPDIVCRIQLNEYLESRGVSPARCKEGSRHILEALERLFVAESMSRTIGRSRAIAVLALIHADLTLLPTFGLCPGEASDFQTIMGTGKSVLTGN